MIEKMMPEMKNAVKESKELQKAKENLIEEVIKILKRVLPGEIEKKRNLTSIDFPVATPLGKPINRIFCKQDIKDYIAAATDGSEIPIDFDFPLYYYVINIGKVIIKYGKDSFFFSDSIPKIFYKEKDLFSNVGRESLIVKGELLESKMLLQESIALSDVLESVKNDKLPKVSLIDGTLIQWEVKGRNEEFKQEFIDRFQLLFEKSKKLDIPVAGYISGSHSKEIVGIVKLQCLNEGMNSKEIKKFDILQDVEIFHRLLKKGERSVLFRSNAPILRYYKAPVYFFYLNVGKEIARVEIPQFVMQSDEKMELLHKLLLSQAEKGMGYPVALKEAHEQAVIHNGEKSSVRQIFIELLNKEGISSKENYKSLFKQTRDI